MPNTCSTGSPLIISREPSYSIDVYKAVAVVVWDLGTKAKTIEIMASHKNGGGNRIKQP